MKTRLLAGVLLLASLSLFFVDLGGSSIWDANEAFYVETPREMIERGDFVVPFFNYEPRLNKPVLSYWIVAGLYQAFGVSIAVQRFGIAIGAVLIIGCAFCLGWLLESRPAAPRPRAGPESRPLPTWNHGLDRGGRPRCGSAVRDVLTPHLH